jgi:hypothetical protein
MVGFILSTHPVWELLYRYGLPHEIINIIFSYKTFFTPVNFTFKELEWSVNEYECARNDKTYIYSELVNLFLRTFFVSANQYSKEVLIRFISRYYKQYYKDPKILLKLFITFHKGCMASAVNYDHKIRLKCKSNITNSTIMSNSLETNLKTLLSIKFNKEIYNIIKYPKGYQYDLSITTCYKFILNSVYIWRMVQYIVTSNEPKSFSKGDLQLYNFMMGYPYKKSWNRQKLIKNLMVNEPYDNSYMYRIFEREPRKYNMTVLSDIMEKINISTINTENDKWIDYEKTIDLYYQIYKGCGYHFS